MNSAMWLTHSCYADTAAAADKDHPNLLAWYLREEPTGEYWGKNMSSEFELYKQEFARVSKASAPATCPPHVRHVSATCIRKLPGK